MRKRKALSQEQAESIAVKDFFDMILPGVVKFQSDHYICGDSYRCVWAVREYPPNTEEQAILSQLADRSNITLRVYNRLVDSMEQRKIMQNATRRNKLMSGGTDVQETLEAELRRQLKTCCSQLPEPYRQVALDHYYHEMDINEIAAKTGKNKKTLQTQIYRAKGMLRERMRKEDLRYG